MPDVLADNPVASRIESPRGMAGDDAIRQAPEQSTVSLVSLALFMMVVVDCAWICDDAYIGFRVANNFANGYGLRWNVAERVQVYTCPLWVLTLSLSTLVTREAYYTSMVLSLAASITAVLLLASRLCRSLPRTCLVIIAAASSKAFVDYSTSGLENALGYLLAAGFYVSLFHGASAFRLSLLASLIVLNRPDHVLLIAPPLLLALALRRMWSDLRETALGAVPLLLWEGFSLVYYGSLVPNTAYAKLNTGLPRDELLGQGCWYFADSLYRDPVTLLVIAFAASVAIRRGNAQSRSVAAGIALYLCYVAVIGGDFMSGRFFSVPFVAALSLLAVQPLSRNTSQGLALATLAVGLSMPCSPIQSAVDYGSRDREEITNEHGVADERACYYPWTGLLNAHLKMSRPFHPWAFAGESARLSGRQVVGRGNVGFLGYFAGPEVYVLDPGALGDALLARLRLVGSGHWRIGHFERAIPRGYLKTLVTGQNQIEDAVLARYYDRLRLVISGPLWSRERLIEVVRLVTGPDEPPTAPVEPRPRVLASHLTSEVVFAASGIEIDLGRVCHATEILILLDNNDRYRVKYVLGKRTVGFQRVGPTAEPSTIDMTAYRLSVPEVAVRDGFDRVDVQPLSGDRYYSISALALSH